MALGDLFKLAKLTIVGYPDEKREEPPIGTFEAQYNPETLTLRHESVFQQQQAPGPSGGGGRYSFSRGKRLSVDLVLDGTHVGYMGVELLRPVQSVADRIGKFLAVCSQPHDKTHEPPFLKILWGEGVLQPSFDCRMQSADVKYTSFDRDGSPLHAELTAAFVEQLDPKLAAAEARFSSPDVTHRRVVREGDTLPLLCREIYGSAAHHLRVAQLNGLDDLRSLEAGQELIFPPFARPGRS